MASSALLKLLCAVLTCMVVAVPHVEALSCNQVFVTLKSCLVFLRSGRGPSRECCEGAMKLKNECNTKALRQTACKCLKSLAASLPGIKEEYAEKLPALCKVPFPYKVSRNMDCSRVN
ncbi:hypothetical protein Ancab_014166 [Ancistrocladus abbreviatus]